MSVFADELTPFGAGLRGAIRSLTDSALGTELVRYRKNVAKRYRIVFPDKIGQYLPEGDLHVSTKVDGELWFLVKKAGEVALVAYNGRVLTGIEVCAEAESHLAALDDCLFAGELFAVSQAKGVRPRVHHVASALNSTDGHRRLGFKVFDAIRIAGEDQQLSSYGERYERMSTIFAAGKRCNVVATQIGDKPLAAKLYKEWVDSDRFEGLVVRSEQGLTYKVKPQRSIDAVVLAFGERKVDGDIMQVRELNVGLVRDDGSYHLMGSVGTGMTEEERAEWHTRLSQLTVPTTYRMANREGTLCRFVRPEVVVQIKCSDLLLADSDEAPAKRMTLNYSPDEGYTPLAIMPIPSLIHPTLIRERDDKTVDAACVGLEQLWRYLPFEGKDDTPVVESLAKSETVRRGVWVKETKGKLAVRKYVVIATNKGDGDARYPSFVVHYTDFSAGRKEPLKTAVQVASTTERADELIDAWVTKNVKRGWVEHE